MYVIIWWAHKVKLIQVKVNSDSSTSLFYRAWIDRPARLSDQVKLQASEISSHLLLPCSVAWQLWCLLFGVRGEFWLVPRVLKRGSLSGFVTLEGIRIEWCFDSVLDLPFFGVLGQDALQWLLLVHSFVWDKGQVTCLVGSFSDGFFKGRFYLEFKKRERDDLLYEFTIFFTLFETQEFLSSSFVCTPLFLVNSSVV